LILTVDCCARTLSVSVHETGKTAQFTDIPVPCSIVGKIESADSSVTLLASDRRMGSDHEVPEPALKRRRF
jgi:hypothetical protein